MADEVMSYASLVLNQLRDSSWLSLAGMAFATLCVVWLLPRLCKSGPRRKSRLPPVSSKRDYTRGSGVIIKCVSPSTGEVLGTCNAYTPQDVQQAYDRAKKASEKWRLIDWNERRGLLMDILDWVVDNQPQIIQWSVSETGKTLTEASLGEVMTTCEKIRWIVAHGEECLAPEDRPVPLLLGTKKARVEYSPLGVIGIIVPWNYPFHNVLSAVVSALFAGNGALVKVSEWSSFSAAPIEDMFRQILAKRGHSPDLVQIITGYGETGAALVKSGVDKILFIGSPAIGKRVMEAASQNLTPVILELGGKDPFIIFDDVQFDHMIDIAIRGAFINCGQNCIAAERFYVQRGVYDRFVAEIKQRVAKLSQGACLSCDSKHSGKFSVDQRQFFAQTFERRDFGAMTMPPQADLVQALVNDAVKKGAKLLCGGHQWGQKSSSKSADNKSSASGTFFEPTVLCDVTHDMDIANHETFGPVMSIIPFDTEHQVIALANCTNYGLGCSVFTTDYRKAERVTRAMQCGMVTVNDFGMVPMIQSLPFGGCKYSGFGHFNGKEGLRGFSLIRSVVTDRFPLRMEAPKFLQYPVPARSYLIVQEAVKMVYGRSWLQSAGAAVRLVKRLVVG